MSPKFLFATTILHPSPKQIRKERKSHRDQEALITSELQAQSDLAPLDLDDKNGNDDDDTNHDSRTDPPLSRKTAAATSRTRAVKQDVKTWMQHLTRRPKHHPPPPAGSTPTAPTPPPQGTNSASSATDKRTLHTLPGELQNLILASLGPLPLALLRLTCCHFHAIIPAPAFVYLAPTLPPSSTRDIFLPSPETRCLRFAFLTTLHHPPTPSPYLPRTWARHAAVCGQPFYPCTRCKAFHHLAWFAPYGATVRKYPGLRDRPADCRACVLHSGAVSASASASVSGGGWEEEEEEQEEGKVEGLYSPEVWPGFAERVRAWRVGRWWRCECCGRCVREEGAEGEEGSRRTARELRGRSPGRYLVKGPGELGVGGRVVACECGCEVCGMVGVDCWERGGRKVVLYRR